MEHNNFINTNLMRKATFHTKEEIRDNKKKRESTWVKKYTKKGLIPCPKIQMVKTKIIKRWYQCKLYKINLFPYILRYPDQNKTMLKNLKKD